MSTRHALSVFGIVALFLVFSDTAWASQYVMWRVGDSATYRDTTTGREIRAEADRGDRFWNHYTDFAGFGPLYVVSRSRDERVYLYAPAARNFQLLTDFNAPIGFSTSLAIEPCNFGSATLAARESLTVIAGSFDDVIRVDFRTNCADAGVTSVWFARGVGPIQWNSTTIAGSSTYQMASARIGGTRYPRPSGITLVGEFPNPVIWVDRMPGIERADPSVDVFLLIQNNTAENITYSFSSGQHFEIEVIDTQQRVVSKWSTGKLFTQAFNDVTISPGAARRFGGPVVLRHPDGRVLAEGQYTLKVYLTNADPQGVAPPQAAAPIEIAWAH